MMKAKCRYYKQPDVGGVICVSNSCPSSLYYSFSPFHCSLSGYINIDWISYIKMYNDYNKYFDFEDIIYDE